MDEPFLFIFTDTATTEFYTLSLHDALPISVSCSCGEGKARVGAPEEGATSPSRLARSEEHTSELQSRQYLVCRLLLEKKNEIHEHTRTQLIRTPSEDVAPRRSSYCVGRTAR